MGEHNDSKITTGRIQLKSEDWLRFCKFDTQGLVAIEFEAKGRMPFLFVLVFIKHFSNGLIKIG